MSPEKPELAGASWANLRAHAHAAASRAYCPYSGLAVGAAALARVPGGGQRLVSGANVENASYGLTLCAECSLVSDLVGSGGGRIERVAVVDSSGQRLAPCGRCRQLLAEHGGPELLVDLPGGPVRLGDLLSHAFGAHDLPVTGHASGPGAPA